MFKTKRGNSFPVDESAARVNNGVTLCDGYNIEKSNEHEYLETVGVYKSITPKEGKKRNLSFSSQ